MAKLSGDRNLPAHNLAATTASEAYVFTEIVSKSGIRHLDTGYLSKAMVDGDHLMRLRAGGLHRRKCDTFVDFVLDLPPVSMEGGDADDARQETVRWLGLYSICSKVLKVRLGTKIEAEDAAWEEGALCSCCPSRQAPVS